mgnify:CR=1 FL=1
MEKNKDILRPAFIEYNGKTWYIDLRTMGDKECNVEIKIIEKDGSRRAATGEDGNLMDVLEKGKIIKRV